MKSIAIILSYAMSVAADSPTPGPDTTVPTNTGLTTMSGTDALSLDAKPDSTLTVVQPSPESSSDNSFSINEVEEEKIVRIIWMNGEKL
jgi:hypothetical protein